MTTRGPVNRCAIKGCPVIGHWPEGACCPMHDDPFDAPGTLNPDPDLD
jgi:hypothetical protein